MYSFISTHLCNPRMSDAKPAAAAATSTGGTKKRSKVSFSEEVLSKDTIGDGNKVMVEEEHGVFLSLLGQRKVVTNNKPIDDDEINGAAVVERVVAKISFGGTEDNDDANDDLIKQKLAYSEKRDGNIIQRAPVITETKTENIIDGAVCVEYDNLVIKIGLLKIGHRYRMIVPIPNRWGQIHNTHNNNDEVKIIEDSLDDDLRGGIDTEYLNSTAADDYSSSSTTSTVCHHYLNITLSAKRRGPYRGRFVLELTRYSSIAASSSSETPQKKCIMSVQVDATIMGKDMGTPKLRNGVVCLGKIVGYDSDDETEWQGFD